MCPLFETIRIFNGIPVHTGWHEARMALSRRELWNLREPLFLNELLKIPEEWKSGLVRCNVSYGPDIRSITFESYVKRRVNSLKLLEYNNIDYHLKRSDRSILDHLFSRRGDCDEIIIIKNGFITDTSISNLIFFDGKNWVTPSTPLLNGTCRQRLLNEGKISEKEIRVEDLSQFAGLKLINAMRFPEEESIIPASCITM
jgi:4-amino-4-deoxychorismate lyase